MAVNPELYMIAVMGIGGIGFALGGTEISERVKGKKWIRRDLTPVLLALICLLAGVVWWRCAILAVGLDAAFRLGYGESKPYWYKFLVGCAYVVPTFILGFTWWQVIHPLLFVSVFRLSNLRITSSTFVWKVSEFLFGSSVGIIIALLIP